MVQWVKAFAAKPSNPSPVPETHIMACAQPPRIHTINKILKFESNIEESKYKSRLVSPLRSVSHRRQQRGGASYYTDKYRVLLLILLLLRNVLDCL